MPNRIDELFSLHRLRSRWDPNGPGTDAPNSGNAEIPGDFGPGSDPQPQSQLPPPPGRKTPADALKLFDQLVGLVDERFPFERTEGLRVLLGELREQLGKLSSGKAEAGGPDDGPDEGMPALYPIMESTLDQIEEVLEALDLASTKK